MHPRRSPAAIGHARNAQERKRNLKQIAELKEDCDSKDRQLQQLGASFSDAAKVLGLKSRRIGGQGTSLNSDQAANLVHAACQPKLCSSIGLNVDRLYAFMSELVAKGELEGFIRLIQGLADWKIPTRCIVSQWYTITSLTARYNQLVNIGINTLAKLR